ncbi:MAG: ATP-binding protein [Bacteroidota bacterium]|nr:sensor histidine kinase [Candidatus Kapabacteria bacterium]MDW8220167.1 ATP-binding protein [Bacteroidota bacterium]
MSFLPYSHTASVVAVVFPLGILLILSLFHWLLYVFYKQERYNLYFVFLCLTLAANDLAGGLHAIVHLSQEQQQYREVVFRLSSTGAGLTTVLAVYATLYKDCQNVPQRRFLGFVLPVIMLSLGNSLFPNAWSKYISLVVVMGILWEVVRTTVEAVRIRIQGSWILAVGVTLFVTASLLYWVIAAQGRTLSTTESAIFMFSDMLIMPITMALWTAHRFALTHKALEQQAQEIRFLSNALLRQEQERRAFIEQQNLELERQVQERTAELQEKLTLLAQANQEIQRQSAIQAEQAAEIQSANTRLQEQNAQLQELDKEKNELLSIVVHDLKNPLSNIMILAEMMRMGTMQEDYKRRNEALELITSAAKKMLKLINNMLDISRIEQGKLSLNIIQFDAAAKLRLLVQDYRQQAENKQITIHCAIPEVATVAADSVAFTQVVDNLLSNAIKYSPLGKSITVGIESLDHNPTSIRLFVQDEGPGISSEDMKKLFTKFTRLSAQPTAGEHSTGLGLSIVKRLVEAMHGRVWCESELGKGAKFLVELPTQIL